MNNLNRLNLNGCELTKLTTDSVEGLEYLRSLDLGRNQISQFPSDALRYTSIVLQGMSCKGVCMHAHVRYAVARVHVHAKSILESVGDVRACGPFLACYVRLHFCTL